MAEDAVKSLKGLAFATNKVVVKQHHLGQYWNFLKPLNIYQDVYSALLCAWLCFVRFVEANKHAELRGLFNRLEVMR